MISPVSEPAIALQDLAAPDGVCFGCGSAHPSGLHLKSFWNQAGTELIGHHTPDPMFTGWPDLVYGGLLAMLIDCHSNWMAMASHYRAEERAPDTLPRISCVTAQLGIRYLKPTPMGVELTLRARVEGELGRKTRIICEVWAGDTMTVTADSIFVRVDTQKLAASAHSATPAQS